MRGEQSFLEWEMLLESRLAQGRADPFLGLVANFYTLKGRENFNWKGDIK